MSLTSSSEPTGLDVLRYRDVRRGAATVGVAFTDARVDVTEPDAPGAVARLDGVLVRLGEQVGARVVRMRQVHGADVVVIGPGEQEPPTADSLVTRTPGVALMTRAADCVPVLLADVDRGLVAAVHAGRRGVESGVVPATLDRMRSLGAGDVVAWIGPHVCGGCYEVPGAMREEVAAAVPQTWSTTTWGTASLDLGAGVRAQLEERGATVAWSGPCTVEDATWWSYRRDGEGAGRMAGLVWIQP